MFRAAAPPRVVTVDRPTEYEPLRSFSCGQRSHHDTAANELIKVIAAGTTVPLTVRVAEHPDRIGEIMAISATGPVKILPPTVDGESLGPLAELPDEMIYIALVGVGAEYHGLKVRKRARFAVRGISLGDYMLRDAMAYYGPPSGPNSMPPFWSQVASDNEAALKLCALHDFALREMGSDFLALRKRGARVRK
jgi:hypothetical protein